MNRQSAQGTRAIAAKLWLLATLLISGLLSGCGGGGGLASVLPSDPNPGIGGTGVTSSGTIDGFGSIFVNGIKFETDDAEVLIDGEFGRVDELELGMVVIVTGTINEDGVTGVATRVEYDESLQGPIDVITPNADGDSLLLSVLGQEVIVERTGTVFSNVTFESLAVGDLVEVSGFTNRDGQVRATRVNKESELFFGNSDVALEGIVSQVTTSEFLLGGIVIDYTVADLSALPDAEIVEGARVEVQGDFFGDSIRATSVREGGDLAQALSDGLVQESTLKIQGAVTEFLSDTEFSVDFVRVDAVDAILSPADFLILEGIEVQVDGVWDGSVLRASEVRARRGRIEIEAPVAFVDDLASKVTLDLPGGGITVELQADTRLNDDTGVVSNLSLEDLSAGDFLGIEAVLATDGLVATRIDRIDFGDVVLQAPVDSFSPGFSVTLLNISYFTMGTRFENGVDAEISAVDFYGQLRQGDLIKIRDAKLADGRADIVEFEAAFELDGDSEFDGDCQTDTADPDPAAEGACSPSTSSTLIQIQAASATFE